MSDDADSTAELVREVEELRCRLAAMQQAEAGRRREEKALWGQMEWFRDLQDPVIRMDLEFRIADWNRAAEAVYGWQVREVIGRTLWDVLRPEYPGSSRQEVLAALQSTGHWKREAIHSRRDGTRLNVLVSGTLLRDACGMPAGALTVNRDITEHRQAQEALRASEERYRAVFQGVSAGIVITDLHGRYLDANKRACEMLGYTPDELLGMTTADLTYPSDTAVTRETMQDLLSGRCAFCRLEKRYVHRDGRIIWADLSVTPTHDARGQAAGFIAVAVDITDRKLAEQALRQQTRFLQELIDSIPNPVYYKDLHGRYQGCNEAFTRFLGVPREQVVGSHVRDRAPPDLAEVYLRMDAEMLSQGVGATQAYESLLQSVDGRRREVVFHKAVFTGPDGRLGGIVGIVQDITEHKRAEQRLRASHGVLRALTARLEQAREEERARLARRLHDDIGHALAAVKMDLGWVARHLEGAPEQRGDQELRGKLREMTGLVEEAIATAKAVAVELRPGVLDDLGLAAAIEWATRQFESRTGVRCRLVSPRSRLRLDRGRSVGLYRVFQEMLTNVALHARATRAKVRLRQTRGELSLQVTDNGVGISAEQAGSPSSLGILGMRERVEMMGGRLEIRGRPGRGTTLTACVPLAGAQEHTDAAR